MKALWVARKSLIEIVREPQLLALVLLLPVIFLGITYVSYPGVLLATYPVDVVADGTDAAGVDAALQAQTYPDGRPVFDVRLVDERAAAEAALINREAVALVVIAAGADDKPEITIKGDALDSRFFRASAMLDNVVYGALDRLAGRQLAVTAVDAPIFAVGPETLFDQYAPGMMIFALAMLIPQTAMLVAREIRWGTLRRLRLSRVRAVELLGGISLAQLIVAALQVAVIFALSLALGFHNHGSLILAIGIGLLICVAAIGQGLIVACFVENDSQAANVGATVGMLQVFLSGAMYQLPPLTLFSLGGQPIDLFDVFPATHGFQALQQVLTYGGSLGDVALRIAALAILGMGTLGLGIWVFQRRQLRARAG